MYTDIFDVLQYVDEVIIGAPYSVTEDVLNKEYKVHVVAHGNTATEPDLDGSDAYEVWQHKDLRIFGKYSVSLYIHLGIQLPKQRGIYVEIENPNSTLTTQGIIDRIIENRFV